MHIDAVLSRPREIISKLAQMEAGEAAEIEFAVRQIPDLVRLLTISDIFAALIESRPYSPTMPRRNAYQILRGMDGKLDQSLVRAFQKVALGA